jgi:hypothetical protein
MKALLRYITCSLALAVMASTANAGLITYTFENPGADLPTNTGSSPNQCNFVPISGSDLCADEDGTLVYTKAGRTLTAGAGSTISGVTSTLMQDLQPTNSGLAVVSQDGTTFETNSDDQIQEFVFGEFITFSFDRITELAVIDFNRGGDRNCTPYSGGGEGPCGLFDLYDMTGLIQASITATDDLVLANVITDTSRLTGNYFKLVARDNTTDDQSGFTIGSVSVVPAPTGVLLLGFGILALAFTRKAA